MLASTKAAGPPLVMGSWFDHATEGTMNRFSTLCVAASLALSTGCKDKDEETPGGTLETVSTDAGMASRARAVDRGLAKAVENVAQGKAAGPSTEGAPPERGVFETGQADRELAPNQAAKVTMGAPGQPPLVKLGSMPKPGSTQKASLELSLQLGQGGLPPVAFDLSLRSRAPRLELPSAPKEGADPAAAPGVDITATVDRVGVNSRGMGVPEDLAKEVGKLKGSRVTFHMGPRGETSRLEHEVAKSAGPTWNLAIQSLGTALTQILLPFPEEPMGAGGYFLVVTRSEIAGVRVLSYRMVKVESIKDGVASLSLTGRHYAVDRSFAAPDLAGGQPLDLDQFSLQSEGRAQLAAGQTFPISAQTNLGLSALLVPPSAANQQQASPPDPQKQRFGLQARVECAWSAGGVDKPLGVTQAAAP